MKKNILSKDQIKHIAKLANLSLDEKELQVYTEQLASVLRTFFGKIRLKIASLKKMH